YLPGWPAEFAGLIPLTELLWGCCLLVQYRTKPIAVMLAFFTAGLTIVYTYGLFFKGITECGCFGQVEWLKLPPWGVYLRNGLLMVGLLWLWQGAEDRAHTAEAASDPPRAGRDRKAAVLVIVGGAALFMTGSS